MSSLLSNTAKEGKSSLLFVKVLIVVVVLQLLGMCVCVYSFRCFICACVCVCNLFLLSSLLVISGEEG